MCFSFVNLPVNNNYLLGQSLMICGLASVLRYSAILHCNGGLVDWFCSLVSCHPERPGKRLLLNAIEMSHFYENSANGTFLTRPPYQSSHVVRPQASPPHKTQGLGPPK